MKKVLFLCVHIFFVGQVFCSEDEASDSPSRQRPGLVPKTPEIQRMDVGQDRVTPGTPEHLRLADEARRQRRGAGNTPFWDCFAKIADAGSTHDVPSITPKASPERPLPRRSPRNRPQVSGSPSPQRVPVTPKQSVKKKSVSSGSSRSVTRDGANKLPSPKPLFNGTKAAALRALFAGRLKFVLPEDEVAGGQ